MKKRVKSIFPAFLMLLFALTACGSPDDEILVTETYDLPTVTGVVFETIGQVTIQSGENNSLTIVAEPQVLNNISFQVNNQILHLSNSSTMSTSSLNPALSVQFIITVQNLQKIEFSGNGSLTVNGSSGTLLNLDHTGVGNVYLKDIIYSQINLSLSGGGLLEINGVAKEQNLIMNGAIHYNGENLESETVTAELSGNSQAILWVEDSLTVNVIDTAHLSYYGFPENVNLNNNPEQIEYLGLR